MPRVVTLVLQRDAGSVVGELAPFSVETPWWQEIESVVEAAATLGVDVSILRLLRAVGDTDDPWGMGGAVAYSAQLQGPEPDGLLPVGGLGDALVDDPLRLPWARPGGPARELAWAEHVLAERGIARVGPPHQMRTWNLSSIWTIPTKVGRVWLKSVPPFFAHEGAVIEWLADACVPPLIGWERGRVLMAEIAGTDQHDAELPMLERAVHTLVAIQGRVVERLDELRALGLPDWRWPALRLLITDVFARHRHELDDADQRAIETLIDGLGARCDAIDACGLPMTLVHGDFHPGNLRADRDDLFVLDWGDCGLGHPLFDVPAMAERVAPNDRDRLMTTWVGAWRQRVPGSDPRRAAALVEPLAVLRRAVIYRGFLDAIEPSERCYHAGDPALWLRRAAAVDSSR